MANELKGSKQHLKELFGNGTFYNIPQYQRPYVWGQEQIEVLLDDLDKASNRDKEYFLGCMVWNTKQDKEKGYNYQDILDGQQRFITLYLLLAVLRDISDKPGNKKTINNCLKQEAEELTDTPARARIEFEIREDSAFLENFVLKDGGTIEALKTKNSEKNPSVKNMAAAISYISSWWEKQFKKAASQQAQNLVQNFLKFLLTKVSILYVATPDSLDDAYNLFTTINGRGIQLRPSDILKAQNLREVSDEKQRRKYAENWAEWEESFDEQPFESFDAFLWSIVGMTMKYRSDDNLSLSAAFDHMHKTGHIVKGSQFFTEIEKYISHYQNILSVKEKSRQNYHYFDNLIHILCNTSTSRFVLPLMYYREKFGDYRITEFLIKLDNLFSVMWITGKRDVETRMFMIMRQMDELLKRNSTLLDCVTRAADSLLIDSTLNYDFKHDKAKTDIDINDFFDLLDKEAWGDYAGTRINKFKYILLKLDLICGNRNTRIHYQRTESSMEHILPRHIENTKWSVTKAEHEIWCHRLGNLVLLDKRKNTSMSNDLYHDKKKKYSNAIGDRAYTNKVFMDYNAWTIQNLIKNHQQSVNLLKQYYEGNSLETVLNLHKR